MITIQVAADTMWPPVGASRVQGRAVVENDSLPGVDLAQLGRETRAAVKDLLASA